MAFENEAANTEWLAVIGRSLAMLVLHGQEDNNASLTKKADVLLGLGLSYKDAAEMLGTTEKSLRELRRQAKKGRKRGK